MEIRRNIHITLNGKEVQRIDDYNVLAVYRVLWLPKFDRENNVILKGINPKDGNIKALQAKASR